MKKYEIIYSHNNEVLKSSVYTTSSVKAKIIFVRRLFQPHEKINLNDLELFKKAEDLGIVIISITKLY
jgi:hypothetical protein